MLNNTCKSLVIGGYWVTFINIHNLSTKLMSALSNVLTQLNDKNETITINNEKFKFFPNDQIVFATTSQFNQYLTNSTIDSLKITKIDHYLNLISKDLLDKFRIVKLNDLDSKSFISANLIANGFSTSHELGQNLIELIDLYKNILKQNLVRNGIFLIENLILCFEINQLLIFKIYNKTA